MATASPNESWRRDITSLRLFGSLLVGALLMSGCDLIAGIRAGAPIPESESGGSPSTGGTSPGGGGNGGSGGEAEGGAPTTVSLVTVLDRAGSPYAGATVLVHDADGELVTLVQTGDGGQVEVGVPEGGSVTTLGQTSKHSRQTYLSVPKGAPLTMHADRDIEEPCDLTIDFANVPAGAPGVSVWSTCPSFGSTEPAGPMIVQTSCYHSELDLLGTTADDSGGLVWAYLAGVSATDPSPPPLDFASAAASEIEVTATGLPHDAMYPLAEAIAFVDGQYLGSLSWTDFNGDQPPDTFAFEVPNAGFLEYLLAHNYSESVAGEEFVKYSEQRVTHLPFEGAIGSIDLGGARARVFDAESGEMLVTGLAGTEADFFFFYEDGRYVFVPSAAVRGGNFRIPRMPAGFEEFDIPSYPEMRVTAMAWDYEDAPGYAAALGLGFMWGLVPSEPFAAVEWNGEVAM